MNGKEDNVLMKIYLGSIVLYLLNVVATTFRIEGYRKDHGLKKTKKSSVASNIGALLRIIMFGLIPVGNVITALGMLFASDEKIEDICKGFASNDVAD